MKVMDMDRQFISLRLRAILSNCDRVSFDTFVQTNNSKDICLFPKSFQLEFTVDEEEDCNRNTEDQTDEERQSVDTSTTSEEAAGYSLKRKEDSSEESNMMQRFEETLAMRKMVQVQSLPVEEDKSILEARTRTFVKWINSLLHSKGIRVKNLDSDLESGVVLIKLLETLAHEKRIPGRYVEYYWHLCLEFIFDGF